MDKDKPIDAINETVGNINREVSTFNKINGTTLSSLPVITPESLAPVKPFVLPPKKPQTEAAGLLASLSSQYETETKKGQSADEKIMDKLLSTMNGSKGEAALSDKEYSETVDPARVELNEINSRIAAKQLDYRRQIEKVRENKAGLFGGAVEQEVARIERQAASEEADLSIIQAARQNKYATAKDIADRKVRVELEQDKQKLDNLKFVYEKNLANLTKDEDRVFQLKIKELGQKLTEQEAEKKGVNELALRAIQNGAPTDLIERAFKAPTQAEAASLLGSYAIDQKEAIQMENLRLDNQKLSNELSPNTVADGVNSDLTAYASQYADTGKLPSPAELKLSGLSVGQVTSYAKQLPKPIGSLVSVTTGTKSPSISPTQEDGILALYDITKKTAQLKELEEKRVKGLTSATLGKVFGAKDQENYLALRQEIIDLLSRARTGAALTAAEEKFYTDQLPGRIGQVGFGLFGANTQNRVDNFDKKIKGTLDTKLSGYGTAIYGYSKVKVSGTERTVGEILDIGGVQYKVLPDGTLTDII